MFKFFRIALLLLASNLWFNHGYPLDSAAILKQIQTKYTNFSQEVKDLTLDQTVQVFNPNGDIVSKTVIYIKDKLFRMESETKIPGLADNPQMQTMKTTVIFDGQNTWMLSPLGKQKLNSNTNHEQQAQNWWNVLSQNSQVIGQETINGADCYIIETNAAAKDFTFTKLWIDTKKFHLIKASGQAQKKPYIWLMSDFRPIKGAWEMPFKTELKEGEKTISLTTVNAIKANNNLNNNLFDLNKDATQPTSTGMDFKSMMKKSLSDAW